MSTRILAFDTTTEACSAAIMFNDTFLERFVFAPRKHTQFILPMIHDLLSESGITLKNLDALAFSRGPGSFTGIRISIGIAQGLALGANLPIISISTLAILAVGAWRQTGLPQVLVAIDARMGEVYWAPYQLQAGVWQGEEQEALVTKETLSTIDRNISGYWATAGTGWQRYPALLHHKKLFLISGKTSLPRARDMLHLALYHYKHDKTQSVAFAKPEYLRNKVTDSEFI